MSVKATDKADAVTKAIDSFITKVKDIKFKAKVDDADIEKLTDARKKLIGDESKLLEDHRKENKEILIRHFYEDHPTFGVKNNTREYLRSDAVARLCRFHQKEQRIERINSKFAEECDAVA